MYVSSSLSSVSTSFRAELCIIDKPHSLDTGEAHVKKLGEKGVVQENDMTDIAVVVESQSDEFGRQ